ncbi:MAG: glycosyltransferase [Chitinophagaceae bacterium]|nr:glycosyltransferase [Chitinophagaceae bacterium]
MPLISVIMPVYNAEKYVSTAIESILTQTFTDFELLIFNDGSTDKSGEIIQQFTDPRIKLFDYETNAGLVTRLNAGIDFATGKYIARMDADDISLPLRFEKQVHFLENNPEIGLCGAWIYEIADSDDPRKKKLYKYVQDHDGICIKLLRHNSFAHPVVMMRRIILIDHEIRYEHEYFPSEDYRLWIRLKHFTRFYNIPETLLHYRVHKNQTSTLESHNKKSTGIKIELIRELLVDLSEKEEALYTDIIKQKYKNSSSYLSDLYSFINRIINTNKIKKAYPPALLTREFESIWKSVSRKCIGKNRKVILFWMKLYPTKNSFNYYAYIFYLLLSSFKLSKELK